MYKLALLCRGVLDQVTYKSYFQPRLLYIFKARCASLPGSNYLGCTPLPPQVQQRDLCHVLRNSKNCWHSQPLEHETSASIGPKQVCPCACKHSSFWANGGGVLHCFVFTDAGKKQETGFQSISASALLKQQKQKLLEARKKRSEEIQRR